jgi:ABC-type glycerol-3-phosphate transport system substrate-binding protein
LPAIHGYNPKAHFAMFPFPGTDDTSQTRVPFGPSGGLAVPSQAKNKETALRFLEFAAETYPKFAVATGAIPAVTNDPGAAVPGYAAELKPYLSKHQTAPLYNDLWPNPEVLQTYMNGMQELLLGKSSPEEVSDAMDSVWTSEVPE